MTSIREATDSKGCVWQVCYEVPGQVVVRSRESAIAEWSHHGHGEIDFVVPGLARELREAGEFALVKRLGLRVRNNFRYLMAGLRPEAHCIGWSDWEEYEFGRRRYESYFEPDGRGNAVSWTRREVEYESDKYEYVPQDFGYGLREYDDESMFYVWEDIMSTPEDLYPGQGYWYPQWTKECQREVAMAIWPDR